LKGGEPVRFHHLSQQQQRKRKEGGEEEEEKKEEKKKGTAANTGWTRRLRNSYPLLEGEKKKKREREKGEIENSVIRRETINLSDLHPLSITRIKREKKKKKGMKPKTISIN